MQLTSRAVPAVPPCCGPAGVKQDTLDRLRRIAQQAPDLPCFATVKPQWGLRRLLAEGFRPAQLCKRAGVSGRALGAGSDWGDAHGQPGVGTYPASVFLQ